MHDDDNGRGSHFTAMGWGLLRIHLETPPQGTLLLFAKKSIRSGESHQISVWWYITGTQNLIELENRGNQLMDVIALINPTAVLQGNMSRASTTFVFILFQLIVKCFLGQHITFWYHYQMVRMMPVIMSSLPEMSHLIRRWFGHLCFKTRPFVWCQTWVTLIDCVKN